MLLLSTSRRLLSRATITTTCLRFYTTPSNANGLVYPDPPSRYHHDLPSFLKYASREDLDPASTVYVGTHYEYTVQAQLRRLGIVTQRIGGANDQGIDLVGAWHLPTVSVPVRLFAQCKVLSEDKTSTKLVRELEGTYGGAPGAWKEPGAIGLLVTTKGASKPLRAAVQRSMWPMGFVMCTPEGRLLQLAWNKKAEELGLQGCVVITAYSASGESEIRLSWRGNDVTAPLEDEKAT